MTLALVVALAGAAGAVLRYLLDGAVGDRTDGPFPHGTWVVNIAGSLVLGFVTGLAIWHGLSGSVRAVVGVGFCGGLTTWSAASWETVVLFEDGLYRLAALNAFGGLAAAMAGGAVGLAVGYAA